MAEDHGGLGAAAVDLVVAFETLGYHAVPGPLVESAAVAPALLTGDRLAALAGGDLLATVVAPPEVPLALDADVAGVVLDLTGAEITVAESEVVRSIDPARRLFRASGAPNAGAAAFDRGVLAVSAQLLGAGQWLLDTSVEYAKQRSQYGRAIGEYQAIKHLLADVVDPARTRPPAAPWRGRRRRHRSPATSRRRRSWRATPPTSPPARPCRCTAPSATPPNTTSACG